MIDSLSLKPGVVLISSSKLIRVVILERNGLIGWRVKDLTGNPYEWELWDSTVNQIFEIDQAEMNKRMVKDNLGVK